MGVYENVHGTIEDCEIYANVLAGVVVKDSSDTVVQRCKIHNGKSSGVYMYENGQGTIEDSEIFGNAYAGVEVRTRGNAMVRKCQIHLNKYQAVWVYDKGQGTIEDCDLTDNVCGAWDIGADCQVIRRRNKE